MKTAEERKQQSIERLKAEGIPFIDWLPTIEEPENVQLKSQKEIAKRLIACMICIQASLDQEANDYNFEAVAFYQNLLSQYKIDNLTPNEQTVFEQKGSELDLINMTWKYEACWALFWALGLIDELKFPSEPMTAEDCELAIALISQCESLEAFLSTIKMRSLEEIMDEADLIYRYHWACVNARIKGEAPAQNLYESVVMERRAGLDWLFIPDADWDNPELST